MTKVSDNKLRKIRLITRVMGLIAAAFALFHVYTAMFGVFDPLIQRGIFVGAGVALVFAQWLFIDPLNWSLRHILDLLLALIAFYGGLHVALNNARLMDIMNDLTAFDKAIGIALTLLVLEAARRSIGITLPLISVAALVVFIWGNQFIGGDWRPPRTSLDTVLSTIYGSTKGLFGYMSDIGTRVIAIFIIFGSLLMSLGGGDAFKRAALVIAGRSYGGPAKVSVVTSAFFGTVSGSAVANVMSVGSVTIPTMVRAGYRKEFAAGVEATASAGGQIVPPVMGAGAVIMAEILNIPYYDIALAATIPALLYFLAIFVSVDCFARASKLRPLEADEIPRPLDLLREGSTYLAFGPIFVLAWLLFNDYTPTLAGGYATLTLVVLALLIRVGAVLTRRSDMPMSEELKRYAGQVWTGLVDGGRGLVVIAALVACASIFLAALNSTGMGVKLSQAMLGISGEHLFALLLLTAVLCIILGMDVPTTASYLLAASVAAPLLGRLGLPPLTAHLFIFYFAILSAITPPVCASVYAAATLVDVSFWKVAGMALRVAGGVYFIPFLFVSRPSLLMEGSGFEIMYNLLIAGLAISGLSISFIGYLMGRLDWWSRILICCASLVLFYPAIWADLAGLCLMAGIAAWRVLRRKDRLRVDA
mgnify:CR=1 FL=1